MKLTKDEYEAWRANPATEVFMEMLADWASETREQWRGALNWTDESKIEVMIYDDLVHLPFEKIEEHFNEDYTDDE